MFFTMFYRLIFILFIGCFSISTIRIAKINNAHLISSANSVKFAELSNINSLYQCICQCLGNSQCLTATYYSFNQRCLLFSATIKEQWLGKLPSNKNTTVITRANETWIPCSKYNFQQPPTLRATGSGPIGAVSSDFNKDGHVDLAVSNTNANSISILLGLGNGSFELTVLNFPTNGTNSYWHVAEDFNDDGNVDLAVCNEASNTISLLCGLGNDSFYMPVMPFSSNGSLPSSVITANVNNDTKLDLIVTNTGSHYITTFLGYGNGTFQLPGESYAARALPSSVASADFNNDGKIDLAVVSRDSNSLSIFFGFGNGSFQSTASVYATESTPYLVRTKDFNGDLISDLVVGNFDSNSINIFINNGMGMFIRLSSSTYTTSIINPIDIAIQDLDGDAVMDLAISNQLGNISTYYGYGNGTFGGIQTLSSAGHSLKAIIASDFDEDGLFDLAILNQDNNAMAVLLAECN